MDNKALYAFTTLCIYSSCVTVGPRHCVDRFDKDNRIASVPIKLVVKPEPSVGDECSVRWSDGVVYTATVLAMGEVYPVQCM